ncbi:exosortase O [Hahella sp. HN01]|uniref:exosortase O n=1 Tax=Hahella sp. HN01 TaxID=2847262 RepID=UPI0021124D28|nr:exosortase O [Hahella sp. HN01]MBU6954652.1 exosortase O [Hahella sp. HN01]
MPPNALSGTSLFSPPLYRIGVRVIIATLFLWLFSPVLAWIGNQMLTPENEFHVLACLLLVGVAIHAYRRKTSSGHGLAFQWRMLPFALLTTSCFAYLLNEYVTGIHIFSATLMTTASYGLLGLYVAPSLWRSALIPCALLIFALPFEGYLDIYLGFPLRLLCADLAGDLLSALGVPPMSNESIILIENKAAVVDLACSGLKGIWAGMIFFLLLTWLERKALSWRWLAVLMLFLSALIFFNALRITALVYTDLALDAPQVADHIHTALGALGFVLSCALAWLALTLAPSRPQADQNNAPSSFSRFSGSASTEPSVWRRNGELAIAALLVLALFGYTPHPKQTLADASVDLPAPPQFAAQAAPLSDIEAGFFDRNAATARKYLFSWRDMQGSLILVHSRYWKAQHDPRNCYRSQGVSIDDEKTWVLPDQSEIKYLRLDQGARSAFYWFQSADRQTADYSSRVFSAWREPEQSWVMVSIAWNSMITPDLAAQATALLRQHVQHILTGAETSGAERSDNGK